MPIEQELVSAEDAPVAVSKYLGRRDVRRVTLTDTEGETIIQVAGTADPDVGARQVLAALGEPEGGTNRVRVIAETGGVRRGPTGVEGAGEIAVGTDVDDPLRSPDLDEPEPHE